jgi:hypothetical protein
MKPKTIALLASLLVILLLVWLFTDEREHNKRLQTIISKLTKENENLKRGYFELLEKYLKTQSNIAPDIIAELQKLKLKTDNLDTNVHYEIDSVIRLVNKGQGAKAVKDLAKIVESKLKEKVLNDKTFNKQPKLHFLLEHARDCKWIKPRSYENGILLKDIRNEESHELAVQKKEYEIGLAIFAGIEILYDIA